MALSMFKTFLGSDKKKPSVISPTLETNAFLDTKITLSAEAQNAIEKDLYINQLKELHKTISQRIERHASDEKQPTATVLPLEQALELCRVNLGTLNGLIEETIKKRITTISNMSVKELQNLNSSELDNTQAMDYQTYQNTFIEQEGHLLKSTQVAFYGMLLKIIEDHNVWTPDTPRWPNGTAIKVVANNKDKTVRVPTVIAEMIANITGVTSPSQKSERRSPGGFCSASDPISTTAIASQHTTDAVVAVAKTKQLRAIAEMHTNQTTSNKKKDNNLESEKFCNFLSTLHDTDVLGDPVRLRAKITETRIHHAAWLTNTGWASQSDSLTAQPTQRLIS